MHIHFVLINFNDDLNLYILISISLVWPCDRFIITVWLRKMIWHVNIYLYYLVHVRFNCAGTRLVLYFNNSTISQSIWVRPNWDIQSILNILFRVSLFFFTWFGICAKILFYLKNVSVCNDKSIPFYSKELMVYTNSCVYCEETSWS